MYTLILHAIHNCLKSVCCTYSQGRDKNVGILCQLSLTAFLGLNKMGYLEGVRSKVSPRQEQRSVFESWFALKIFSSLFLHLHPALQTKELNEAPGELALALGFGYMFLFSFAFSQRKYFHCLVFRIQVNLTF